MIELEHIIMDSFEKWQAGQGGKKRKHPSYAVYRELFKHMFPYAAAAYGASLQLESQQVNIPVEQNESQVVTVTTNQE